MDDTAADIEELESAWREDSMFVFSCLRYVDHHHHEAEAVERGHLSAALPLSAQSVPRGL